MKKIYLLIVCSILFFNDQIFAQTIQGKILEQKNQQAIEYSNVALYQLPDSSITSGAVTNPQGEFQLDNLKPGNYYLMVQFIGYETQTISNIQLKKGQILDLGNIYLKVNAQLLNEIEISGEKATTLHKIDRQVFEASKFESAKGGTVTDLLRNMPSVTVNALGEITVRGTSGFVVLLNGKPLQTDAFNYSSTNFQPMQSLISKSSQLLLPSTTPKAKQESSISSPKKELQMDFIYKSMVELVCPVLRIMTMPKTLLDMEVTLR